MASRKIIIMALAVILPLLTEARQTVGLVLSGGGAKGIAHIGVIQALEENDVAIDYIAGTSMGAIVGGLYAAGYSPTEMMELLASPMFTNASTGTIDPNLRFYLTSPQSTPQVASFSLGNDSIAKSVPQSLISPTVMNFAFMEVFAKATRRCGGDFDRLFVPLRTVSSNIEAQRPEISRSGELSTAIRASMSFPMVFCPVEIRDTLHYDGGIFENFPVETMRREFNPDVMIGVDVHTPDSVYRAPNAMNQITDLVTRAQSYDMPAVDGVKIHIDLRKFSLLDFPKAKEIYDIGYRRGLEMVDSIKATVSARRPYSEVEARRKAFKDGQVPLVFSNVTCIGGSQEQNRYVASQFPARRFSLKQAREGFYRAISSGQLQDLQVQAEAADSTTYTLKLRAFPKPAWSVGIGGYISSSTSSMLYASVNYNRLSQKAISGAFGTWIGQSYMAAQIVANIRFGSKNPYSLGLQGVVSKRIYTQAEKLFFQVNDPKFVTDLQGFGRAYLLQLACGPHAVTSLSAGYGYKRSRFYDREGAHISSDLRLGQLALRYDYNTLNTIDFPTSGMEIHSYLMGLSGHRTVNTPSVNKKETGWVQAGIKARKYWDVNRHFAFGISGELLASTRKPAKLYDIAMAEAPAYTPTPSCHNSFNSSFRAYSFLGLGVNGVWKITNQLHFRQTFHIFAPWQTVRRGANGMTAMSSRPGSPNFLGEVQAVFNLKLVSLCLYGNYRTGSPADRGWHCGITLGVFALASDFLN